METENAIHEAIPYLRVRDTNHTIEFDTHTIMLSDEYPEHGIHGPEPDRPSGSAIHLHVDDVDAMTSQAVSAGARLTMEPADQFHGERSSKFVDPFGHEWYLGSKLESVSREEMQRRFAAMFKND